MGLDCIDQLDVADCSFHLMNGAGNAFIAFAAETHRPPHAGSFAGSVAPLRAYFGEIVGPDVDRAAAVGAMHDDNRLARKLNFGICLSDSGIVPVGDLAE